MSFTAQEIFAEIDRQAAKVGVPADVAKAFFVAENTASGKMTPDRVITPQVSPKGARGVMQTMPTTEELLKKSGHLRPDWQFDPKNLASQVEAGLSAMQEKLSRAKNPNDPLELAAMYNGGTAGWKNYRAGLPVSPETQGYFKKVQTAMSDLNPSQPRMTPQRMEQTVTPSASTSSSARATFRTTVYDPLALDAAMNSGITLTQNGGAFDTALAGIAQAATARKAADAAQQAAVQDYAAKQGVATAAETAVTASEAARRKSILDASNLNPDFMANQANQFTAALIGKQNQIESLGREIDERMAVGIYDNPFQWMVNQTRLPGMVGTYNTEVRSLNRQAETVKALQATAGTQISLGQAIDADLINKSGAAKVAANASAAQAKLAEIQKQSAGEMLREADATLQANRAKTATLIDLAQLTKQIRSENTGMSEKEAMAQAQEVQIKRVNDWLLKIGSSQQYNSATFKTIPAKTREDLLVAAGQEGISRNLWDGVKAISTVGDWNTVSRTGSAGMVNWLQKTHAEAEKLTNLDLVAADKTSKISGKPVAKRDEFVAANMEKLERAYINEQVDMRKASETNPYRINYETVVKVPQLANNPVTQFLAANGPTSPKPLFNKVDEQFILADMTAKVAQGKLTSSQAAAAVSEFFTVATKQQQDLTKYTLFGMPAATRYQVNIPQPGWMNWKKQEVEPGTVDLMNRAAVEESIIKNVAGQLQRKQELFGHPVFDKTGVSP